MLYISAKQKIVSDNIWMKIVVCDKKFKLSKKPRLLCWSLYYKYYYYTSIQNTVLAMGGTAKFFSFASFCLIGTNPTIQCGDAICLQFLKSQLFNLTFLKASYSSHQDFIVIN